MYLMFFRVEFFFPQVLLYCFFPAILFLFCLLTVLLPQYCAGDKIEKNEMGGACGTYGGRERCAQGFGGET